MASDSTTGQVSVRLVLAAVNTALLLLLLRSLLLLPHPLLLLPHPLLLLLVLLLPAGSTSCTATLS
jgi:hypothetical protein